MHPQRTLTAALLAVLLVLITGLAEVRAQESAQKLPTVQLNAGMHLISAELARTPQQRAIGLMHRRQMGVNEGMLFAFERPGVQCFWMKNTLLPLTIAFLDDEGAVLNLADMQPESLQEHCSSAPVRYALEMNLGWFAKRGVKVGSRIAGGPFPR